MRSARGSRIVESLPLAEPLSLPIEPELPVVPLVLEPELLSIEPELVVVPDWPVVPLVVPLVPLLMELPVVGAGAPGGVPAVFGPEVAPEVLPDVPEPWANAAPEMASNEAAAAAVRVLESLLMSRTPVQWMKALRRRPGGTARRQSHAAMHVPAAPCKGCPGTRSRLSGEATWRWPVSARRWQSS